MSTDLKKRNVFFSPPDMTETETRLVVEAIMSGWITTGPKTKEFEKKISAYVHTDKTVCLNSATAAMELALRLIGVGPEDEVIVPAYTYTASASVTQHVGCHLVMVDSNEENQQMDLQKLAEAITERTKVIVPVDLGGVVCEYDKILEVLEQKKGLFRPTNELQKKIGRVIISSDCAHAFGSEWKGKMAGEIGDFSSFSFHAVKNLTSLGLAQMERYDTMLQKRQKYVERFNEAFKELNVAVLDHKGAEHCSSHHLYIIRLLGKTREQVNDVITKMAERGIATNVHYKPLPMMTAYKTLGFDIKNFPNAYKMFENTMTLPLNTKMTEEDVEYVIENFVDIVKSL